MVVGGLVGEVTVLGEVHRDLDGLAQRRPQGQHQDQREDPRPHGVRVDATHGFVKPRISEPVGILPHLVVVGSVWGEPDERRG